MVHGPPLSCICQCPVIKKMGISRFCRLAAQEDTILAERKLRIVPVIEEPDDLGGKPFNYPTAEFLAHLEPRYVHRPSDRRVSVAISSFLAPDVTVSNKMKELKRAIFDELFAAR